MRRFMLNVLTGLKKRRYTDRFAKEAYRLTAITTNLEAGWYLGVDDSSI